MMTGQVYEKMPSERVNWEPGLLCQAGRHDLVSKPWSKSSANPYFEPADPGKEPIQVLVADAASASGYYGEGSSGRLPWRWSDSAFRRHGSAWNLEGKPVPGHRLSFWISAGFLSTCSNGFVATSKLTICR